MFTVVNINMAPHMPYYHRHHHRCDFMPGCFGFGFNYGYPMGLGCGVNYLAQGLGFGLGVGAFNMLTNIFSKN